MATAGCEAATAEYGKPFLSSAGQLPVPCGTLRGDFYSVNVCYILTLFFILSSAFYNFPSRISILSEAVGAKMVTGRIFPRRSQGEGTETSI